LLEIEARQSIAVICSERTNIMDIRNIDLNLLVIFDAVISERNMTSAAQNLGIRQPAVSRAMARLRAIVGFDLIKRKGHGVEPTPQALDLAEKIRPALDSLRGALNRPTEFDPRTSRHEFMLDIAGGLEATFLVPLVRRLANAPNIKVRVTYGHARALQSELRFGASALSLDYEAMSIPGYHSELLYESEVVVLSRRNHPGIGPRLTVDGYSSLHHVSVVWGSGMKGGSLDPHFARLGINRNIQFVVPTIGALGLICEGSDLIGTVSARTARIISERCAVDVHPMPVEVPPIRIVTTWHRSFDDDSGHRWIRRTLQEIVSERDLLS